MQVRLLLAVSCARTASEGILIGRRSLRGRRFGFLNYSFVCGSAARAARGSSLHGEPKRPRRRPINDAQPQPPCGFGCFARRVVRELAVKDPPLLGIILPRF
jgi:hypothetical protein